MATNFCQCVGISHQGIEATYLGRALHWMREDDAAGGDPQGQHRVDLRWGCAVKTCACCVI